MFTAVRTLKETLDRKREVFDKLMEVSDRILANTDQPKNKLPPPLKRV